ncbi:A-kinase anchor protein 11 [Betta splendens]|uniref:A-kinase anchor protein 11 n=1 Tax=Betta splendens TaxID=158456 RepID=A0A9W2XML3_BETSP|nr:A-kinase anchor protein 11 [Betta splendens]
METAEPKVSVSHQGRETLAEELASAVIDAALREVRGHRVGGGQTDSLDEGQRGVSRETDPVTDLQYRPPLSQTGLPAAGSLDYPDAPPTTPLLPELERSRHSFARKLKGDLAKVFSPSPPPPTPKEEDCSGGPAGDPRVELMEHLMQSLGTGDAEAGSRHGAAVEAFAEALSRDVIDWALSSTAVDNRLHLLAQQLAETIITSSLDEAKVLI